jgi:hypothetical protein
MNALEATKNCTETGVLTVVKMSTSVFWVVTPGGLEGKYQRFRGTYQLNFHG